MIQFIFTAIGFTIAALGIFFAYPIYQFESWVDSRLEIFAEMPYDAWEGLHAVCADLAAIDEALSFRKGTPDYDQLPEPIKLLEPISVQVNPGRISLRFSGGHSRYVHIEFYGDRTPSELDLISEWSYDRIVFPRSDQRPIGRIDGNTA